MPYLVDDLLYAVKHGAPYHPDSEPPREPAQGVHCGGTRLRVPRLSAYSFKIDDR
jgi:hypothetical protein